MIVILDANVLVSDPLLRGSIWPQLTDAISGGRVEVLLPRLALEEAVATYRRRREAKAVEIQAVGRRASLEVQKHLGRAVASALKEAKKYPKLISKALEEVGVDVLDAPQVSHEDVARRAIGRRRPFDDAGSGYRDALHWMSVLEIVDDRYEGSNIIFVSADRRAFGASGKSSDNLHPHLVEELEKRDARAPWFRWLQHLTQLTVPGVFHDEIEPAYAISVTAGELGGYLHAQLWETNIAELLPRQLGTGGQVAAVSILDVGEPVVGEIQVRQYWEYRNHRADFVMMIDVELALQRVQSSDADADADADVDVEEEVVVLSFGAAGHVDVSVSREGLLFSNLELESFTENTPST
ncbi:PIN domain-containing protein [Microbacterium sp. ANT_H45B]|uniref:PIN domain-containing protein n=1 Tax=Microbacterium sp. ANT_H45B TaxID=2597346 RepID=UPI00165DEBF9|nr:PIN domain-containing protein [Microbacterium sp. ANT_H45B]